jgi:hypothetical protein
MTEPPSPPPPRAFTQGVGTVFQFVGVTLFLVMMFVCCASSLLSKDTATHTDLTRVGWHLPGDSPDHPSYSAQLATTLTVMLGVFFGMAVAGLGLGLQAQNRRAPVLAVVVSIIAIVFWTVQGALFASALRSVWLTVVCVALLLLFGGCLVLSIGALREMRRSPPAESFATLPQDYKIPYSHMHADPPEVRLAKELEDRRQRLAVQQKELEMLEEKLKRRMQQSDE